MPAANYAHKHQLKPCPFCGSADLTLDNLADPKHGWFINCETCEIQQIANYTEAQAVALWNRRASGPWVIECKPDEMPLAEIVAANVGADDDTYLLTVKRVRRFRVADQH